MHAITADLRRAWRNLLAKPTFLAVAVLTLAIGIGAIGAVYSVVDGTLLKPLPYPQAERIVRIDRVSEPYGGPVSANLFNAWREGSREQFDSFGAFAGATLHFQAPGAAAERLTAYAVTPGFWTTMGLPAAAGRYFGDEEESRNERVVVIGHAFWQHQLGGRADAVGSDVVLNGTAYRIVGITPATFRYPYTVDVFVPTALRAGNSTDETSYLSVVARLADGASLAQADAVLAQVNERLSSENGGRSGTIGASLVALPDRLVSSVREPLLILLGASALVLLIACANLASLLLARGVERHRELAVRAALGASKARLLRLVLAEVVIIALLGSAVGLAVAAFAVPMLLGAAPDVLPGHSLVGVDAGVVAVCVVTALATMLVFGIWPALRASRADPARAMQDEARGSVGGRAGGRVRNVLVAAELTVALVLLAGAGLLVESLRQIGRVDTGVDTSHVLTASIIVPTPPTTPGEDFETAYQRNTAIFQSRIDAVITRLAALPGVTAVGVSDALPLSGADNASSTIEVVGQAAPDGGASRTGANWRFVNPDFMATLGMRLVSGRHLVDADARPGAFPTQVVVNETFARRLLPGVDPLGREVVFLGGPKTIVGVVADARMGVEREPDAEVYMHHAHSLFPQFELAIKVAGEPMAMAEPVRAALRELDAAMPVFRVRSMDELAAGGVAMRAFNLRLMGGFALVALVLAAIGVYGVIAGSVAQRRREIGLRKAVGANVLDIHRLVLGSGLRLIVPGLVAGALGALALGRLLASQLYGIGAADPFVLATTVAVLAVVAFAACIVPTLRAARVPPMEALRDG
ncbi:ABC transporter permease [Dokdonella sp. MW10]|uniref:ABC transporter permease n=1 Tax=Dokdonella sp. MW10 TaxID=2992926 RepID=UPI003F811882